ncbi:MAG: methyltransferase domain-containing protein [Planctomycetes bacterium]|nr:methyltransferase domain-containing protein [Planctomycetota bacterium]
MTVTPVNYRKQDCSPQAIARDVDYALQIADFYVSKIPGGARRLVGKRVLELGPGYSLGTAVLLACHGAEVTVADRYLSPWDAEYHGRFFAAMLARLRAERDELSPDPILRLLEASAFVDQTLRTLHLGTEDLDEVADASFDVVLSNAVFEHVGDVPRAVATLARITRSGGVGVHQVDFRDHRDFDRPLEYMTLAPADFSALFAEVHGECGNRWRPLAMGEEWKRAGFDATFEANMWADEAYVDDVQSRLDPCYAAMGRDELLVISGCYVLRRRAALNTEYPVETDSPQTLAHSRARYTFASSFVEGQRVLDVGCGAGVGTRMLLRAGASDVVGVDLRPEALELARADDPRDDDAYVLHDLNERLPFPDGSFDVVVALEVLEHVREQQQLVDEIRRVLSPDGVAVVSVPNKAFEEFWTGLAGEDNPYHVHVPDLEEFVGMLAGFPWVDFHGQIDVVASLVLPLDGNEGERVRGSLEVQAGTSITDRGTVTILGVCHVRRPVERPPRAPEACSYGNYQDTFGGAIASNQALATFAEALSHQHFAAANKLRWTGVEVPSVEGADGASDIGPGAEPEKHVGLHDPSPDAPRAQPPEAGSADEDDATPGAPARPIPVLGPRADEASSRRPVRDGDGDPRALDEAC